MAGKSQMKDRRLLQVGSSV